MAFTNYYVDYAAGNDTTGDGSVGTPWKTIQKAEQTIVATDQDQINVIAGTDQTLAAPLDLSTYAPTAAKRLTIRGCTTTANDGGIGGINCASGSLLAATTYDYVSFIDMEIHTFGTAEPIHLDTYCRLINCEIHTSTHSSYTVDLGANSRMLNCKVHSVSGSTGVFLASSYAQVISCFLDIGTATNSFGVIATGGGCTIIDNVIKMGAVTSRGIRAGSVGQVVSGNSIYNSAAGTNQGIEITGANCVAKNNIVEGWNGSGGVWINSTSAANIITGNRFYTSGVSSHTKEPEFNNDNSVLAVSAFADPSTNDFTTGTETKGAGWPALIGGVATLPTFIDTGACQREEVAGGAASILGGGNLSGNFNE